MSNKISVSVIIPAYNASRYVKDCFKTIAAQEYGPSEVVVVDDASVDDTIAQIHRYSAILPCPIIVHSNKSNLGVSMSRNRGILMSSFPWLAFLDVDDQWEANHLGSLISRLAETSATFLYSGVSVIDYETGVELGGGYDVPPADAKIPGSFYFQNFIMPSQVLVSRHILPDATWFNPRYAFAEDAHCWLRLWHSGACFAYTGIRTCLYQKTTRSLSSDALKSCVELARMMRDLEGLGDFPIFLIRKKARNYWYAASRICWRSRPARASLYLFYSLIDHIRYLFAFTSSCF